MSEPSAVERGERPPVAPPRSSTGGASGREIRALYVAELRGAFRERNVVINTVLVPVLLYPLILWMLINGIMFVQGQTERLVSHVVVQDLPPDHAELLDRITENGKIEVETATRVIGEEVLTAPLDARIAAGEVDAALDLEPQEPPPGDFRVVVTENSARESSGNAGNRLLRAARDYREDWLRDRTATLVAPAEWEGYRLERTNLATSAQMGAMILGLIAPIYFVVMVAVGCMYPAVDTTAGEHERGTWETTLTMAASRFSIVAAKYLYVTTMGFIAGLLNLTAMTLSMGSVLAPLFASGEEEFGFRVPWSMMPWVLLGALVLAGSVAAAMMTVAVFARTFREGQAMTTPIMMAVTLPVVFLGREGLELTPAMASIPVVNVAMLAREALSGTLRAGPAVMTIAIQLGLIAILLAVASRVIRNEDVLTGSFAGGPMAFLRQRLGRRPRPSPEVSP